MSGTLKIRFASDMPTAAVDVVTPDMQVIDRVMLNPGRTRAVEVPSERTFLRVHLPSGETVTLQDPGNLDREISMESIRRRARLRQWREPTAAPSELTTFDAVRRYNRSRPTAMPIFEGEGETLLPLAANATATVMGAGYTLKGRSTSRGREAHWDIGGPPSQPPLLLQIEQPSWGTTLSVRLPGNTRKVWSRSDSVREQNTLTFTVRLSTSQPTADTILGYLRRGDLYSAEAMTEWVDEAADMLMSKMTDPYAAAVGGYLLLRLRLFKNMRDWARNLADRFDFLPDGSIIWAWQLIHQQPLSLREIRKYLFRAVEMGMPVYSEGMGLLTDGLRLLGSDGRAALGRVLGNADVLIPSSPLTAFIRTSSTYVRASEARPVLFDIAFAGTGPDEG